MNNQQIPLTSDDKRVIKKKLKEELSPFLMVGFIMVLLCISTIYGLQKVNGIYNTQTVKFSIVLIPTVLFYLFFNKRLISLIKDLGSKSKSLTIVVINNKKSNTNYGWTKNPIVDQILQPSLTEYYLYFDNYYYLPVNKSEYNSFEIGDYLKIYKSQYSGQVLGIYKS